MRTAQWNDAVSVIDRVTLVLGAFKPEDKRLGVSELARRANLPKSTVSRLVSELVEHRYLERDGAGVRPGLRLFELGELATQPRELRSLALATMTDLRDATGQSANLAVLEGAEVVYIGMMRGRNAARIPARVGGRLPAHTTAVGKALLAFSPAEFVDAVVAGGLAAQQPGSITDPDALRRELETVRETGLAYDREESARGILCVASPILKDGYGPIAAISVSGRAGLLDTKIVGPGGGTAALGLGRHLPARALSWPL